jgi:transglutaminase-like putative cysteine protease
MPEGIHVDNFLRADMVLISEAALSAKLKNSSDTLLDKLKAQDDEVEMSNSIPAWNKVYTPGMRVQTADELDALILAAVRNLVPQFEIMLDNAAYDAYFIEQEDPLINLNVGTTHTEYMYETREFVFKAEYSLYHQLQGIIFNRSAVEQYVSAEVRDFDRQMRAILDKIITPNMTDRQKIKAVHDYMVTTYKYDVNFESGLYGNETYTFYGLLKNKTGVCQAYAELFYLFMCYEGIECYFVSGWADDGTGVYGSHLWNVVYVDDGYYHIDVTFDDPVPDGGEISYKYFLKTSEEITKDHTW